MRKVDNANKILALALPTNEPEVFFRFFHSSIKHMLPAKDIMTIAINFQPPWTEKQSDKVVDELTSLGFTVEHTYNEYTWTPKPHVPFNQIRLDAANLVPDALFYALVDDDFRFRPGNNLVKKSAGDQYVDIIHYLVNNPSCGLVLMGRGKKGNQYTVAPTEFSNIYVTGSGYIMRSHLDISGEGNILLPDMIELKGSDEERLAAASRLARGYYPAKLAYSRTLHCEFHTSTIQDLDNDKIIKGGAMYGWGESTADLFASKYIKENYNPDYVRINEKPNTVCDYKKYLANGGIDLDSESVIKEFSTDYRGTNTELLVKELISKLVGGGLNA